MGAAGWEEDEFEFQLVFEEDHSSRDRTELRSNAAHDACLAEPHAEQPISIQQVTNQRAGMHSPPPRRALTREYSGTYESLPARSIQVSGSRVLECPSIQITTISPEEDSGPAGGGYWDSGGGWDRERLYLPLLDPFSYREGMHGGGSLSPSPASSPSSRGWLSPASSCDSLLVEDEELTEATSNFCLSPSSRPTSPGGKRRRNSPQASPSTSRRGSYSEEYLYQPEATDPAPQNQTGPNTLELSIPQKTRKTSVEQVSPRECDLDPVPNLSSPCPLSDQPQPRRDVSTLGMDYLSVPTAIGWGRTRASAHSPLFRSTALPSLDWPLPSQFDQYELRIEVQPRPHHRAHYETEGSRGAVKAAPSGHPIVKLVGYSERQPLSLQVFVGTADDRSIRPHPFYQIHRVTGKMVGTASQESMQAGTKILDIPLTPENNMTALIDCAGILKLRNSDIELRKGETDVGRKNTRVRLVFRTHVPLAPPSRVLALQVTSLPIECSQRSAQELPVIESVSLSSCSADGGQELLLAGANFLPTSRVLFMERGSDGKLQWEEEAHVERNKSSEGLLSVRVPPYSDTAISHPVPVCLYVSNGKRKRSSTQCFKYLPAMFKEEDPRLPPGGVPMCDTEHRADQPFHPPPYPPQQVYQDDYCPKAESVEDGPGGRGALTEKHPSFESLELGFTELLPPPPLYARNTHPPSPSPWLDSPYLSSSPSPSHSSSLSPFPAGSSPLSSSPMPPYSHCSYAPEFCPSPPATSTAYQDYYVPQYGHMDGWEPQRLTQSGTDFKGASPIQHITLEEVNEFIGEDISSFPPHMDSRPG